MMLNIIINMDDSLYTFQPWRLNSVNGIEIGHRHHTSNSGFCLIKGIVIIYVDTYIPMNLFETMCAFIYSIIN